MGGGGGGFTRVISGPRPIGPQDLVSHPSVHGNGNSQAYGHPSSMVQ